MKKLLIGLAAFLVLAFAGFKIFEHVYYGGGTYYTQITTDGEKIAQKDDKGNTYDDYRYELPGYDKNGEKQDLDFNANRATPLRKNAYLKVTYNQKKGVTQWEAVAKQDVPDKALNQLN